jgi:hypothetical protein
LFAGKNDAESSSSPSFEITFNFAHLPSRFKAQAIPHPVHYPVGLMVKNGWNILSIIFWGIPLPLSLTSIIPYLLTF